MIEQTLDITTKDGAMETFICHPERGGPYPAVLLLMDAPGIREELRDMARRLGTVGYYVVLPNIYYRAGRDTIYGPEVLEKGSAEQARMRELGGEYGTVTGRERRCGWLDLVALRYAVRLNGITSIALTKLDVLSAFDKLPVCIAYELRDGTKTDEFPEHQSDFHAARPVCETLDGWGTKLDGDDLPAAAQRYVDFVEHQLDVEVSWVGTGAEREQVLVR